MKRKTKKRPIPAIPGQPAKKKKKPMPYPPKVLSVRG